MAEIKKRRLGRTGLMVAELGLGAMDTPQVKEGEETLHLALDLGINFIDTARIYEGSELLIGKVIRDRGGKDFFVASKTMNRTADGAQYDVDRSMRLLGIRQIDLYQVDDIAPDAWDQVMSEDGVLNGLKAAQARGVVDHIGISSHNLEVVEKAITCGEFETVMLEYSAFSPETERLVTLAQQHDVGIIVMRPLGGSGRTTSLRGLMRSEGDAFPLPPSLLLRYVWSHPGVSVAIPGVRYPDRVRENVETALSYTPLDEAQKRACEEAARGLAL